MTEQQGAPVPPWQTEATVYGPLFAAHPLPMWVFAADTLEFVDVNDAAIQHYGFSRAEFLKMSIQDIRLPEDVEEWSQANAGFIRRPAGAWRHRKKDGMVIQVEVVTHPVSVEGSRPAYLAISLDVTARVQSEHQLLVAASVFQSSPQGIAVMDGQGVIQSVNPGFCRITGRDAQNVVGQRSELWAHPNIVGILQSVVAAGVWRGEVRREHQEGSDLPVQTTLTGVDLPDGGRYYVEMFSHEAEERSFERWAEFLSHHDPTTGIANLGYFSEKLHEATRFAARSRDKVAVLFLNLNRFRRINDSLGERLGDSLLRQTAYRLEARLRSTDTLARIGGDEFGVLLTQQSGPESVANVVEQLLHRVAEPCQLGDHTVYPSASVGISLFPDDSEHVEQLLRCANAALSRAKLGGDKPYQFYTREMHQQALQRLRMEQLIRSGVDNCEFYLDYQPQIDLQTGKLVGVEALMRWNNAELGRVPPSEFIPAAEDSGQIIALGRLALQRACAQVATWRRDLLPDLVVAVNLSTVQFQRDQVLELVQKNLAQFDLPPDSLELELTESVLFQPTPEMSQTLHALEALGVRLAVDDFGTGYSNFSYLRQLRIDRLKIDRSFVEGVSTDRHAAAIARTIVQLGRTLGLVVIAEGVEDAEQLQFLSEEGCHQCQGYFISRPLQVEDFPAWVASWASRPWRS